jgi:hypothetical protein
MLNLFSHARTAAATSDREFAEQLDLLAAEGDCGAHKEFFSKLRSLDSRRPRRSTETFD